MCAESNYHPAITAHVETRPCRNTRPLGAPTEYYVLVVTVGDKDLVVPESRHDPEFTFQMPADNYPSFEDKCYNEVGEYEGSVYHEDDQKVKKLLDFIASCINVGAGQ